MLTINEISCFKTIRCCTSVVIVVDCVVNNNLLIAPACIFILCIASYLTLSIVISMKGTIINVKMPTIVGILTFMSRMNFMPS